ncbi:MAG: DUF1330 domain-containing protein [Paracoccaceae bacterium]|nr:DUF1330 domain-containing protein [Paracoccaceae bacterium]
MPAYWIEHVEVTDEALYGEYAKIATEAIAAHGGEFLARAGRYKQLEGNDRARNVVAVFPTFDDAIACYESPRYQEAVGFAKRSSTRDLVVVEA